MRALACILGFLSVPVAHAEVGLSRAYVLDRDTPALTALTIPGAKAVGSVPLQGSPEAVVSTPDGSRLIVLDQGPGKDKGDAGYQATGKSWATIVDPLALKVLARVELGFGLLGGENPIGLFSANGTRLTLICPGYESKTPGESLARELVTIDLGRGEVAGRLAIDRPVIELSSDKDVKTAFLFTPQRGKKETLRPAELRIVDLQGPSLLAKIELAGSPGPPVLSPDSGFLYLLDNGDPSNKPEKNVPGSVQVVSLATRTLVATLDAGTNSRHITVDEKSGLVLFVNDGARAKGLEAAFGELRVLKGAGLALRFETPPDVRFLRFSPTGDRLYLVSPVAVLIVALPSLEPHPMHLDAAKRKTFGLEDPGPVKEMALSADGKRAFVLYEKSSKLLIIDLDKEEPVTMLTTGRGGIKFMKMLGAVALSTASYYAATQQANQSGTGYYYVWQINAAQTALVVRPDSRFVYVLNTQSGAVTIADAGNGQEVDKIAGGGTGLRMFPGGKRLAVLSGDTLKMIDADGNKKGPELPTGKLVSLAPSPDGSDVIALAEGTAFSLDPATGEVRGRATGFKKAVQVLFAPGPPN
jgi:DNA-binding beta-propeller fold protein YncE